MRILHMNIYSKAVEENDHFGHLGIGETVMLKRILKK
jgi:hypothetical protein